MNYLILIILMCLTSVATAGELIVNVHAWHSKDTYNVKQPHISCTGDPNGYQTCDRWTTPHKYNNSTPGIGYISDDGWASGVYYNSVNSFTAYAGKKWSLFNTNAYVLTAVGTGYSRMVDMKVMPMVAIGYKLQITDTYSIHVKAMPPVNKSGAAAAMISIGKSFK